NGPECTVGRGRYFGPASKTCLRDCPRCKSAKYSLPRVGDWRQPTAPPCTARVLAPSSRSVNFRFFGKRRAQLNERDARITEDRAAMHTFDHELDLVDRFGVVPDADEVRTFESLVGDILRKCVLVIERDFERCDAIVFQPRLFVVVFVISRLNQDAIER